MDKDSANDPYGVFRPLMKEFGARCSPKDFYWAVNEALHAAEAHRYDDRHASMFVEEKVVWERLLSHLPDEPEKLHFLDVGCGTGLVGHFASACIPGRVAKMTLIDPSSRMLDVVKAKAARWPFATEILHGTVDKLRCDPQFDVVTVNSVLHHVVELEGFVKTIQEIVKPGGVLLTAQDPRALAKTRRDTILNARRKRTIPVWRIRTRLAKSPTLGRHYGSFARYVRRLLRLPVPLTELAQEVSEELIAQGIVQRPMPEQILYQVTDVHVPRTSAFGGAGIDVDDLLGWMPSMSLVAMYTYRFHDTDFHRLSSKQRKHELGWWQANDPHGVTLALAFQKRS